MSFKKYTLHLSLLVLLINFAPMASAIEDLGTVNVSVTSNGQAKANATVVVRSWVNAGFEAVLKSDSNGNAVVGNVPIGGISVYSSDESGNVTAKYSGELTGAAVNVSLDY